VVCICVDVDILVEFTIEKDNVKQMDLDCHSNFIWSDHGLRAS